jgi:hypothetical protein
MQIELSEQQRLQSPESESIVMGFIPKSKRRKGNMDLMELLYGDHVR